MVAAGFVGRGVVTSGRGVMPDGIKWLAAWDIPVEGVVFARGISADELAVRWGGVPGEATEPITHSEVDHLGMGGRSYGVRGDGVVRVGASSNLSPRRCFIPTAVRTSLLPKSTTWPTTSDPSAFWSSGSVSRCRVPSSARPACPPTPSAAPPPCAPGQSPTTSRSRHGLPLSASPGTTQAVAPRDILGMGRSGHGSDSFGHGRNRNAALRSRGGDASAEPRRVAMG